jgi:hypothetical protein
MLSLAFIDVAAAIDIRVQRLPRCFAPNAVAKVVKFCITKRTLIDILCSASVGHATPHVRDAARHVFTTFSVFISHFFRAKSLLSDKNWLKDSGYPLFIAYRYFVKITNPEQNMLKKAANGQIAFPYTTL